jgi:hypothetical protein
MQKMLAAQNRERKLLLGEMVKMRGLMPLLMKPRNGDAGHSRTSRCRAVAALAYLSPT